MASGDKVYIADKATLDEVKGKIGSASDTGGSSTLGTVMAKENAILAEVGKIGATNDAQGTETTGSVMAKLNYLVNQVSRYLYNIYAWVNAVISGIGSTTDTGGTTTTGTLMAKENAILTEVNKIGATSETGATVTTGTTMGKLNNLINKINRVSNKENDLIRAGINAFGIQAKNLPSTEIEILNVKGEGYVTGIALTGAYGDAKTIRTKVYVDGELFFDFGITINTAQNSLNAKGLVFGVNSNESTMVYNMCNLANFINGNTGIVGCYYTYLSTPLYFADSLRVTASSTVTDENNYVSIGYGLVGLRENMGYVTIQLLPLEQMKIVEGGYSSMAEFTAGGNTMQQSVVNGDFAQGTTGWNADSAIISAANKILTITGNGLSAFPQAGKTETEIIVNGKYFIKGRCRLNTAYAGTAFLAVQIKGTTGGSFAQKIQNPIVGTWYDIYAIADASTFSGNIRVILYGQFADAATANGKVIEVDGNVGVFAIPITGTPFENMAASEINANISEYWGGLKSVEKVEVVSRGRNLFDG
ncbi:MAG: hypothetical protein EOM28_09335, partial [Clostridia bacterium]|nr:hypothetical protein [Clostridia bacterium]